MELHEQIRELRKATGLTQEELAARTGLIQEAISRFESGHTPEYTITTLNLLARALGKEVTLTDTK